MSLLPVASQQTFGAFDDRQPMQPVMGGDQAAFPLDITVANRQLQRLALDVQARAGNVANLVGRDASDTESLLIF
ncbi:hypothetical protein D3C77_191840 [compost metagenome]